LGFALGFAQFNFNEALWTKEEEKYEKNAVDQFKQKTVGIPSSTK
jgi:hypothetical protein